MEQKEYKNPVCRGSIMLGSACGRCEKCRDEMEHIRSAITGTRPTETVELSDMDSIKEILKRLNVNGPRAALGLTYSNENDIPIRLLEIADFSIVGGNKVVKNRFGPRGEIVTHEDLEKLLRKEEELGKLQAQQSFTVDEVKEIIQDVLVHMSVECKLNDDDLDDLLPELEKTLNSKWDIEYPSTEPEETIPVTLATIEATCGWYEFSNTTGENEWMLNEHHVEPHEIFHVKKSDAIKLRLIRGED